MSDDSAHALPSSAIDDAAKLTHRVLGRCHQPLLQLIRDLIERAVVGQTPGLELPVTPADESVRWLGEIPDHFIDQPRCLPGPQRAAPDQVRDQVLERPLRDCHTSQHARLSGRMATNLPGIGQNLADLSARVVFPGYPARRTRQPRSHRSMNPAAVSSPRQRSTVSKSTPADTAIRAGPRAPRAGTASRTLRLTGSSSSLGRTGLREGSARSPGLNDRQASTSWTSVTHTAPQSLIARWQPADAMDVTGPGTAISGRFRSRACRAVFSAPLRSAASTSTVPRLRAAISPVRTRNPGRVGARPGGCSLTSAPWATMTSNRSWWPRRYGPAGTEG